MVTNDRRDEPVICSFFQSDNSDLTAFSILFMIKNLR